MKHLTRYLVLFSITITIWSNPAVFALDPGKLTFMETLNPEVTYQIENPQNELQFGKFLLMYVKSTEDSEKFTLNDAQDQLIASFNFSHSFILNDTENHTLAEFSPSSIAKKPVLLMKDSQDPSKSSSSSLSNDQQVFIERKSQSKNIVTYEFKRIAFKRIQTLMRLQRTNHLKGYRWSIVILEPIDIHPLVPFMVAFHEHKIEKQAKQLALIAKIGVAAGTTLLVGGSYYFWKQHKKAQAELKVQQLAELEEITQKVHEAYLNKAPFEDLEGTLNRHSLKFRQIELKAILQKCDHEETLRSYALLFGEQIDSILNIPRDRRSIILNSQDQRRRIAQQLEATFNQMERVLNQILQRNLNGNLVIKLPATFALNKFISSIKSELSGSLKAFVDGFDQSFFDQWKIFFDTLRFNIEIGLTVSQAFVDPLRTRTESDMQNPTSSMNIEVINEDEEQEQDEHGSIIIVSSRNQEAD